jgi:5-methylcytosine-specific restriction endonuclease McrA
MAEEDFGGCVSGTIGPQTLSDSELVQEVTHRAARERTATAELIRALIEFDRRRLYLGEGYPSLFAYCTGALHYSEYSAFNRIEVARAAARWPQLLARLEDGSLHLSGARLLAPHLTADNVEAVLDSARHKSKRDIEEIAAHLAHRSVLMASGSGQYRLHLTISGAARDTLQQLQALMAHQVRNGDVAVIVEQALALLLAKVQRKRQAATARPRSTPPNASAPPATSGSSRHIPAAVRRAVWRRDDSRCAFVGAQGRCAERRGLELHHVVPFAAGGTATLANIQLRCRAHNMYEAETYLGAEVVAAARKVRSSPEDAPVDRLAREPQPGPAPQQAPATTEAHEFPPSRTTPAGGNPADLADAEGGTRASPGGSEGRLEVVPGQVRAVGDLMRLGDAPVLE